MFRKICFLVAGVLGCCIVSQAQDFTMSPSVVKDTTLGVEPYVPGEFSTHAYVEMYSIFKNVSESPYILTWKYLTDTATNPIGWILTGVCDNNLCRSEYGIWYFGNLETSSTIAAGNSFKMEARVYAPIDGPNGTGIYKLVLETPNQKDTLVYMLTKVGGTGFSSISLKDQRVALYPNPATSKLTVYADKGLNARKINIVSLVGRQEFSQVIKTGAELSELNTDGLATGMYMLKLTDHNGNVVTSRKFVKN